MPRKNKERKAALLLKQIWTDLQESQWLDELLESRPDKKWTRQGQNIKGQCPWHDDPKPSFVVTPNKGIAKCFGCDKSFLHPVKFIAALRNISFTETLLHLRKHHGLKASIPDALYEKAQAWETHQNYKNIIATLCCTQLFNGIRAYPLLGPELLWTKTTVLWLMARQMGVKAAAEIRAQGEDEKPDCEADPAGVWSAITSNQLVGILPPLSVVENHFNALGDKDGFAFFRKYFADYTDQRYVGAIVFLYHDEPGNVARFKMRLPSEDKAMYWVEDAYAADTGDNRGFFGLNYYRTYVGGKREEGTQVINNDLIVHIHEGEFDTLASIARQIRGCSDDFMALSVSGASTQALDRLTQYGIKRVRIVQDNDKGGDNFIKINVERTNTEKVSIEVFQWPDEYTAWRDPDDAAKRIKDPDEAVKILGYPKWSRYIRTNDCYIEMWTWAYENAVAEITPVQPDRISERFRIAAMWGRLIKHSAECLKFCQLMAKNFEMDVQNLFRDIRAREEDEEGFVKRLAVVILDYFYLIGIEQGAHNKRIIHLWRKDTRSADTVVLNDERSLETLCSQHFGNLYDFVRERVGDPAFLAPEGENADMSIKFRTLAYRTYLNHALMRLAKDLPYIAKAPRKGQGLHYINTHDGVMKSYLVNGKDAFKLVHTGPLMEVTRLEGPSDDGIIFDNSGEEWLSTVKKPDDLRLPVDLVDLFQRLRDMIMIGWAWRFQDLDATFLTAYCMCLPVMTVFNRQTAIMLNAEAQSGKSRFVSGFIGGSSFGRIHMVAHAKALQGYTAASVRQQWDGCALCLCLEEFEDSGGMDRKAIIVRNILELTRDLISEAAVDISIGTTSGEARKFKLKFPLVTAAIKPLRDAASLSRFIMFELVKDERRVDPVISLLDKYGEDGIALTRHQLAVGLLPFMARLRELQSEIEKEYATGSTLPAHVPSRFREAMYPMLAMIKLIAEQPGGQAVIDYKKFAWDFAETRRDQLARLRTTSENEQIFESILSSSFVVDNNSNKDNISHVTSVRIMLASINELDQINKTKKGVYFDSKNEWLIVNWIEATQGVLANTKYKMETPTFLKQVSERSPHYIKNEDARNERVLERLAPVMGPGQSPDLVSVFSVKHLLDAVRLTNELSKTMPTKAGGNGNTNGGSIPLTSLNQGDDNKAVQLDDDMVV